METIRDTMEKSVGTGELINIIYTGGSEPGKARMIMPIKIEGNKLRARCYTANSVKVFSLEKIILAQSDQTTYSGQHKEPETLIEAINPFMDELKTLGWEIDIDDKEVGLYTFFKNGSRKKTPSIRILYTNNTNEGYEYFEDDYEYDPVKKRPWYVHGHSFKYLSKAIAKFMVYARDKAPNQ